MTDKRKIITALVIVGLAALFVIIRPSILKTFLASFNDAYNKAQESKTEKTKDDVAPEVANPVSITIRAERDVDGGFNVIAEPKNFLFYFGTPPADLGVKFAGVIGYGDVLVDGKLAGRMYQPWFYIEDLAPGNHEVTVKLFKGDHTPLIQDGAQVSATTVAIEQ